MILYTTLNLIKKHHPGADGYQKLRRALGKGWGVNKKISLALILEVNDMGDAIWALRAVDVRQRAKRDRIGCLFALDCAEHVLFVFEKTFPDDKRPRRVIQAARDFVGGKSASWNSKSANARCQAAVRAANGAASAVRAAPFAAAFAVRAAAFVVQFAGDATSYVAGSIGEAIGDTLIANSVASAAKCAAHAAHHNAAAGAVTLDAITIADFDNAAAYAAHVAERAWQEGVFRKYLESA